MYGTLRRAQLLFILDEAYIEEVNFSEIGTKNKAFKILRQILSLRHPSFVGGRLVIF